MKQLTCPNCGSKEYKPIRKMWKQLNGKPVEGKQYRCGNPDCRRYFVKYPVKLGMVS